MLFYLGFHLFLFHTVCYHVSVLVDVKIQLSIHLFCGLSEISFHSLHLSVTLHGVYYTALLSTYCCVSYPVSSSFANYYTRYGYTKNNLKVYLTHCSTSKFSNHKVLSSSSVIKYEIH